MKFIVRYQNEQIHQSIESFHIGDTIVKNNNYDVISTLGINITSLSQKYSYQSSEKFIKLDKPHILKHFQDLLNQKSEIDISCEEPNELFAENLSHDDTYNAFEKYTFDDPKLYKGFTIDAWPPSKDRNVSNYINDAFTRFPSKIQFHNKELLIVVQSKPSEIDLRMMWRHFVGKYSNDRVSIIFLFGSQTGLDSKTKLLMSEEMIKNNDIVLIDGFVEHYHNLTLKSLYSLKLFLDDAWYPNSPKFMLKVDVDVFVNIPKLYKEIVQNDEWRNTKELLMGDCNRCHPLNHRAYRISPPPFYDKLSKQHQLEIKQNPSSKWMIPSYMYNKDTFPTYLTGPAYLVSRGSAECLLRKAKDVPFLTLEDVYVTGFLAQECDIKRLHHPGFYPVAKEFNYEKDITNHLDYSACVHYTGDIIGCSFDRLAVIDNVMKSKNKC